MFVHEKRKVIIFAIDAKIAETCAIDNALDSFLFYEKLSGFGEMCSNGEIRPDTHAVWIHPSANLRPDLFIIRIISENYGFQLTFKDSYDVYANLLDTHPNLQ